MLPSPARTRRVPPAWRGSLPLSVCAAVLAIMLVLGLCAQRAAAASLVSGSSGYVTDGDIYGTAASSSGGRYVGGWFSRIGPDTGKAVRIPISTGLADMTFPRVEGGYVEAIIADGSGGFYLGGTFTSVGGVTRNGLAQVSSTGTVSSFNPGSSGMLAHVLILEGSTLYVGGEFTTIGGASRTNLAALDTTTGLATSWNPTMTGGGVYALVRDGSGNTYAGGLFTSASGSSRAGLAMFGSTGTLTSWNPGAASNVWGMSISGSTLYVVGGFTTIGGVARGYGGAFTLGTSSPAITSWNPRLNSFAYTVAATSTAVYIGGIFSTAGSSSSARQSIVAISPSTGEPTTWNPGASSGWVWDLEITPAGDVAAAGYFDMISGTTHPGWAILSAATGAIQTPDAYATPGAYARAILVTSTDVLVGAQFGASLAMVPRTSVAEIGSDGGVTAWAPSVVGAGGGRATVNALAADSSKVYIGGTFATVGGSAQTNLTAVSTSSGARQTFASANAEVTDILLSGTGYLAVGGWFSTLGGSSRAYLGAISTADGSTTVWNPSLNGVVHDLDLEGSTFYAGGAFTTVGATARNRLAAWAVSTGSLTSWNPSASASVTALDATSTTVYAAGSYTTVGGQTRAGLAALSTSTGLATTWDPLSGGAASAAVRTVLADGSRIWVGGQFTSIAGASRSYLAAFSSVGGSIDGFGPSLDGNVWELARRDGSTLEVFGEHYNVESDVRPGHAVYSSAYSATGGVARVDYFDGRGISWALSTGTAGAAPTSTTTATTFQTAQDRGDNYGSRARALVIPSTTGSYRFRLRADDQAVLRLSTSASPSALSTIAAVAMWSADYADTAEQTSAAVTLTAGDSYLLESWQADGGSGDGLFVQWQLPDGTWQDIPSANLSDPGDVGCSGWCPPTAVDFTSASGFNAAPVLTWTAFPGAASYRVYRWSGNDVKPTLLGTTSSTTFTDTTVTYQGSLGYNITAVSASGVPLAVGESYWPYHDTGAPTAPTVSGVPASSVDQTAVTLTASGSTDAATWLDHYQSRLSYDNGTTWQAAVDGASRDVTATGSTLVQFRAVDGAGNASTWTQVTVTIDRPAPGAPGTPTGTSPTSGSPTISWSAPTTGGAVGSYDIYRDAVWIGSTNASTRTYTDAAVVSDGSHAYRVVPHRAAADLAVIGAVISLRITGTPSFISASTSGVSAVALGPGLSKTAAAAAAFTVRVGLADPSCYSLESVGVTGAYLRRSGGILVAQTAAAGGASFATDATFCIGAWVLGTASGTTSITATAATPGSDPNGGVTAATAWSLTNSSAALSLTWDTTLPSAPTGLTATTPTASAPALSWTAASDGASGSGIASYRIRRSDAMGTFVTQTATTYTETATLPEGTYTYYVQAVDNVGNVSTSATVAVVVDTRPPAAVTSLALAASPTNAAPVLTWTASSGAASYRILRDGAQVGTTTATTYADSPTPADGAHEYAVVAVDAAGNASDTTASAALQNGQFTTPATNGTTFRTVTAGGTLGAWSVVSGSVDQKLTYWPQPPGGGYSVDLDGSAPGAIEQSFATTAGAQYRVLFAFSANGDQTGPRSMRVTAASATQDYTFTPPAGWSSSTLGWTYRTFTFAAAATSTTLRFASLSAAGNASGPAVGDISVSRVGGGTTVTVDTTAPSAPTLSATSPTKLAPALTWTSVADAASYQVLRGGVQIATTTSTTYTDTGRSDGGYAYTVRAVDAATNASAASNAVTVVVDATAPNAPTGLAAASPTNAMPALSWTAATEGGDPTATRSGVASYTVALNDGTILGTTTATSFAQPAPAADGSYTYYVRANDGAGNASGWASITVVLDTVAPAPPTGLVSTSPTAGAPAMSWTASSGATSYRIYRDGTLVGTTTGTSFQDPGPVTDGSLEYAVAAVDAAGNASSSAVPNLVTDGTFTVPAATGATWLTRSAGSTLGAWTVTGHSVDRVETYWQAPPGGGLSVDLDGSGPGGVEQTLTTVPGQAYRVAFAMAVNSDSGAGTVRSMRVWTGATFGDFSMSRAAGAPAAMGWAYRTFDFTATASSTVLRLESLSASGMTGVAVGDVSVTPVGATTVVAVDTVAPPAPTLTATSPTASAPALTWTQIGDATEYRVFRGGSQIATVAGGATTTYTDSGRSDGSYSYTVKAVDAAGNASAASAAVSVVVDATAPSKPTGVAGTSPTASAPAITWTASSDAASDPNAATAGVASYRILRDGALVGTSTTTSYTDSTAGNGTYVYTVQAVDGAGNTSAASTSSATILHDTVAPTVPSGVAASSPTAQPPALTWTASTDAGSGIALYRIYRASTGVGTVLLTSTTASFTEATTPADGTYTYTVRAVDGVGLMSSASSSVTVVVDTTAPAAPTGLAAASPTAAAPALSWTAASDGSGSGIVGYRVARDGTTLGTVAGTSFTDTPTPADGTRTYSVRAVDAAGNLSTAVTVDVDVDTTTPGAPSALTATTPTASAPALSWTAPSGAVSYRISRDGTQIATQTATTFTDAAQADGSHTYSVVAVNRAGTLSSPAAVIVVVDATAPTAPTALAATASATAGAPSLTWTAATDAGSGVVRYDIYRAGAGAGGVKVGSATGTSYSDAAALADGSYTYTVRAVDAAGNVGSASSSTAVLVDTVAPSAPSGLAATTPTRVAPALTWTAATDAGAGILRYRIRRDGTQVATRTTATYTDPDALADGSYAYDVVAEDAAGNLSAASTAVTVVLDTAAPATPAAPTASSPTNAAPALTWAAVSGAATYRVLRDGTVVDTVATTSWVEPGSLADGSYAYALVAVDTAGNASAASATTAVQLDTVPPSAPSGLAATSPTASAPALSWTASTSSSGAISQYRVYRNGAPIAIRNVASYTDTATLADGSYTYTVTRYDLALNESAQSAPLTVVIDRTSPGSPTDLAATSPTAAAPALSWTAPAADATGIAGYRVYRDSTLVGSPTGTSFTDALPADGTYAYVVRAVDGAGNLSPVTSISVTVDTVAPPTPAAPSLTTPTASLPALAWSASSGATSYRVLRDGAVVTTTASTTWTETAALADGTYAYAVSAVDAAGNASAASSASTVVLDRAAPSAVTGLAATSPTASAPSLSWTAATDATSGVALYRVLRDGVEIGTTTSLGYVDAASIADGVHGYDVIAVDAAGNASAAASIAVTVDTVAPAAVVSLTGASPTASAPALSWTASAGASTYRVRRDGTLIGTVATTTYVDTATLADGAHAYAVEAVDAAGNVATASTLAIVVDRTAPSAPAGLAAATPTASAPALTWSAATDATSGVALYIIELDGQEIDATTGTSYTDPTPRADGTRTYGVRAVDGAGNTSSAATFVVDVDTSTPGTPTSLAATSPTAAAPTLSWTAPAGAASYRILRDGTQIATTASTSYTDAPRPADGSHTYVVRAVNAAGTVSGSASVVVLVDATAPGTPAPTAAASPTGAAPVISWPAASDAGSGVTGYVVERDGAVVGQPAGTSFTDAALAADGTATYRVRAVDAAGNASAWSAQLDVVYDATAPSTPSGLGATSPTQTAPVLAWSAATDATSGVARYRVLRDGVVLGTTTATTLEDVSAAADGTYVYAVVAVDEAGNASAASSAVSVVVDATAPAAPSGVAATSPTAAAPSLSWDAVTDAGSGLAGYRVLRDGALVATVGTTSWTDASASEGSHVYAIRALDQAGNVSAASATVTVVLDATAPAAPSGLAAPSPTAGAPVLGWTAPAADAGTAVAAYRVLRDGSLVATVGTTGYTDAASLADGSHAYVVRAVDAAGNVSADASVAVVVDATAPSAVGALAAATPTGTLPVLTWSAATDATSGIDRYLIARDGTIIATTTARTYRDVYDDPSMADGVYVYTVTAEDRAGNRDAAATVTVLVDQTAPSTPGDLAAATPTSSAPALAWSPSSDGGSGVASYRVLRDGAVIATVNGTSFVDASVGDGTYQYAVRAVDAAGNASGLASLEVIVDTTTPGDPGSLTATSPTASAPSLTWSAGQGAVSYRVLRDGALVTTTTATSFVDATQADGSHVYVVRAINRAGTVSGDATTTVLVDATAPAAPTGLAAPTPTASAPALTWTAADDGAGSGVVSYVVTRDGTDVATVAGTTAIDGALAADGVYAYAVRAVDAAGNVSATSTAITVRRDATAPTVPLGLAAAASPTAADPSLAWSPATDAGAGITGYRVRRDGAVVATVTGTTYADPRPADGSYAYTVEAVDAAGNASAASAAVTVVVDATPPAPATIEVLGSPTRTLLGVGWETGEQGAAHALVVDGVERLARQSGASLYAYYDAYAEGTHTFAIASYDAAGNRAISETLTGIVDKTPPATPAAPTAGASPTAAAPALTWTAVADAVAYRVLRDGAVVATVAGTAWSEPAVPSDGTYAYALRAVDAAGNASPAGPATSVVVDTVAPDAPARPTATSPTASAPLLSWAPIADAVAYRVLRDGTLIAIVTSAALEDAPRPADGSYDYVVRAVDAAGNISADSPTRTVVVDTAAPAAPAQPTATTPTASQPVLSWSAVPTATLYRVLRDGAPVADVTGTTFTDAGPLGDGGYAYSIIALDAAGNASAASDPRTVVVDTTAPDAPAAPTPAATLTDAAPSLSWSAVAGAASYVVLRDGVAVATVAGTSFTEPSLPADAILAYSLIAVDAAGNASAEGPGATVEVDTSGPLDGLVRVAVRTETSAGNAIEDAAVHLVEPGGERGPDASGHGVAVFDLPVGTAHLRIERDGGLLERTIQVARGMAPIIVTTTPVEVELLDVAGDGVADVPVAIAGWSGTRIAAGATGADGSLTVERLPGDYVVEIEHAGGFEARSVTVAATPVAVGFELVPVTVELRDVDDRGVEGAEVQTRGYSGVLQPAVETGGAGSVVLERLPGPYAVSVAYAGGVETHSLTATASGASETFRLVAVEVSVLDVDGDPVAGAAVESRGTSGSDIAAGSTGAAGTVVLERLVGSYYLTASYAGGAETHAVTVGAGGLAETFQLVPIEVSLLDPAGDPVAGGVVETRGLSGAYVAGGTTTAAGPLVVERLVGSYALRMTYAGGVVEHVVTATTGGAVDSFQLLPLAVSVLDADGAPVPGAAVSVAGAVGEEPVGATGASGGLVLGLLPGTYDAHVVVGARDQRSARFAVPPTSVVVFRTDGVDVRTAPAVPTGLDAASPTAVAPALTWDAVPGAAAYEVVRDGVQIATTTSPAYTDAPAPADGIYSYRVRAVDVVGTRSALGDPVEVDLDSVLPTGPTALAATSPTAVAPALTWTAPFSGARSYRVYRDGVLVGSPLGTAFADATLPDGTYTYAVTAVRPAGESAASDPVQVLVDATAPSVPDGDLAVDAITRLAPRLRWDASQDGAGSGIAGYRVLRDGIVITTTTATSYTDADAADGSHTYTVVAVDAAGNASAASAGADVEVDTAAPVAPTGLVAAANPARLAPSFTWQAVADAVAYRLLRDGTVVAETSATAGADPERPADGEHVYGVVAVDAAGNVSASSTTVTVLVDATAPLQVPALAARTPEREAPSLAWLPVEDASAYQVYRDGAWAGTVSDGTRFVDLDVAADGSYSYTVSAVDEAGNEGLGSDPVTVVVDRTAPAAPAAPSAESPTASSPELTWPAVTGAVLYRVLRDGTVIAEVATASYTDELAAADGVYRYAVVAIDEAGNVSEPGAEAAVVLDTLAPAAPVPAAEDAMTAEAPALTWPAVDGADRYEVRRDGDVVGTVRVEGFVDAAAPEGVHAYVVVALDAAGNASEPSAPVEIELDATAPAAPDASATSPTNAAPRLIWEPVPGADTYRVSSGDTVLATVATPVFEDVRTGDGARTYVVVAIDAAGNVSAPSGSVEVVVDTVAPAAPTGLAAVAVDVEGSPELTWSAVGDAAAYVVERSGAAIGEAAEPSYADVGVSQPGRYTYTVRARDAAGNVSAASDGVRVRFRPGRPGTPGAPEITTPTRSAPSLRWTAVPNAATYIVVRDGVEVATVADVAFLDDAAPLVEGEHRYALIAVTSDAAESDTGPEATVVVDRTAPAVPTGLVAASPTRTRPDLTWTAVADAATYVIERDGAQLDEVDAASFRDAVDVAEGDHAYAVRAVDAAGNASEPSAPITVTVDRTAPDAPTLSALADATVALGSGEGAVLLALGAPGDAVRVLLERDGATLRDDAPAALVELRDAGLDDQARYVYRATAFDLAGNASEPVEVAVETPDRTPPSPAADLHGTGAPLVLSWNPDPGTTWTLGRGGAVLATTSDPTWTDDDAIDEAAPAVPANLRVAGLAETSVTVEWDAPADAGTPYAYTLRGADEAGNQGAESDPVTLDATSGVARYRVLVDGAVATETDRTGATVTGLRRGVAHLVQVIAIDGAGNESEPSAELSAGEDLIPARPAGLAAATPTNAAPIVTWPAVEDAESYLVRRDGEELGSVTEPRFVDDALADEGEHAYTVAAVGPAGKPSPWSEPLAVVYDVTPPDTELLARTPDPTRATASVEFRAPGAGTTFRCAVDDAAATTCTSPWNISGLTTGEHVLAVTATDAAGNVEDEPLRIVVETDADAPAAPTLTAEALRDAPEGVLRTRLAAAPTDDATRIVVSTGDRIVHDGAAVSDLLDASPLAPEITYVAVAYDVAGNASPAVSATVEAPDRVAPEPPTLSQVAGAYPVAIRIATEAGATVALHRGSADVAVPGIADPVVDEDAVDATPPAVPTTLRAPTLATTTATVIWNASVDAGTPFGYTAVATDAAGNASAASPELAVRATSGTATYRVLVDGVQRGEPVTEPRIALTGLEPGTDYQVRVIAVDVEGNASAPSTAFVLHTDDTEPGAPVVQGMTRPVWTRTNVAVRLTAKVKPGTAPVRTVVWRFLNGDTLQGVTVKRSFAKPGSYPVQVKVTDAAARASSLWTLVIVDGTAPTVDLPALVRPGAVQLAIADDRSGVASVVARIGEGPARRLTGRRPALRLAEGRQRVRITATDRVGNVRTIDRQVVVDGSGPTIIATAPAAPRAELAEVRLDVSDPIGLTSVVVDGRAVRRDATVRLAVGAAHRIEAVDRLGNRRVLAFTLDEGELLEPVTDPALDGVRGDQLWYDGRRQTGMRLWLLRAVVDRFVVLGYLPAPAEAPVRFTPEIEEAVKRFHVAYRCSGPGKADWGTIGPCTKATLDRLTVDAERRYRAG